MKAQALPARRGGLSSPAEPDLLESTEPDPLQRRFQMLFEFAPVPFCALEGETIVASNRAFDALVAPCDGESLLGLPIHDVLGPDSPQALAPILARALAAWPGDPVVQQCSLKLSGVERRFEVRAVALAERGRGALQLMLSDITQQSAERAELEQSRHEVRQLSASVVKAREEARLRIARELHDELGQHLSALKLDLASLDPAQGGPAHAERVAAMLGMIDQTMTAVRRIIADLRPLILDDLGLNAAVQWLSRESAQRMGLEITVHLDADDPDLDKDVSVAVYRMVQEALTNVRRYSRATHVRVDMRAVGDGLLLSVQDNGVGFAPGAMRKPGSFGLLGIRERAVMLGGSMQADNPPGGGARVAVRLPLRRMPIAAPAPSQASR